MQGDEFSLKAQRHRRLSDEEIELWLQVARTIERRSETPLPLKREKVQITTPRVTIQAVAKTATARVPTALSYSPPQSQPRQHELPLAPLERRLKQKILRGRSSVDQVLDLHGLRQAEAHYRLQHFLARAQASGAKVVLVITGKGRNKPEDGGYDFEVGVLRRLVPHWLRGQDMRSLVIGFEEAGQVHGGSGALLVRVRKNDRG